MAISSLEKDSIYISSAWIGSLSQAQDSWLSAFVLFAFNDH